MLKTTGKKNDDYVAIVSIVAIVAIIFLVIGFGGQSNSLSITGDLAGNKGVFSAGKVTQIESSKFLSNKKLSELSCDKVGFVNSLKNPRNLNNLVSNAMNYGCEKLITGYYSGKRDCGGLGDLNCDFNYNILDIEVLANCILDDDCVDLENGECGDLNHDEAHNILDIVNLANCILDGTCGGACGLIIDNIYKINNDSLSQIVPSQGPSDNLTGERFGSSAVYLGNLRNDGTTAFLVGEPEHGVGCGTHGAVWIIYLNNQNGELEDYYLINSEVLGIPLTRDHFGNSVTSLGDFGDGTFGLAVGESHANDASGRVWILRLDNQGTLINYNHIDRSSFGEPYNEELFMRFGNSVANLGDLKNDGTYALAVGEIDTYGHSYNVWILYLNNLGEVVDHSVINTQTPGFESTDELNTQFGKSLVNLGDLKNNGATALGIGNSVGDIFKGEVWIVYFNGNGDIDEVDQITRSDIGIPGGMTASFAQSLANLGDLKNNGGTALAIGDPLYDTSSPGNSGAVWVVYLSQEGQAVSFEEISSNVFENLEPTDSFGFGITNLGDFLNRGTNALAVGIPDNDEGCPEGYECDNGAVWILQLS